MKYTDVMQIKGLILDAVDKSVERGQFNKAYFETELEAVLKVIDYLSTKGEPNG